MRMRDNQPLISVLMGVRYLREDLFLLKRAVNSILSQSYENFEFLICENGSREEVKMYLRELERAEAKVRLINGVGADTLAEKLNRCLKAAKGEYIARMDDDDVSCSERLATQMEYLQNHSEVAFVGSIADLERDGEAAGRRNLPEKPTARDFYFVQPFLHPTLFFRREILEAAGGYCESSRCDGCEDYDLLLRLYECGMTGANIQTPLLTYTLPPRGRKNRSMGQRWNEAKTRFVRFRSLGVLPQALPYVIKPLVVGLVPSPALEKWKERREKNGRY